MNANAISTRASTIPRRRASAMRPRINLNTFVVIAAQDFDITSLTRPFHLEPLLVPHLLNETTSCTHIEESAHACAVAVVWV